MITDHYQKESHYIHRLFFSQRWGLFFAFGMIIVIRITTVIDGSHSPSRGYHFNFILLLLGLYYYILCVLYLYLYIHCGLVFLSGDINANYTNTVMPIKKTHLIRPLHVATSVKTPKSPFHSCSIYFNLINVIKLSTCDVCKMNLFYLYRWYSF